MTGDNTVAHSVTLGPPEHAARAAVDKGWFMDDEDLRMMGFGRGVGAEYRAAKSLRECIQNPPENIRVIGIYLSGIPVGMFWVETTGDEFKTARLHFFVEKKARGKWAFHVALKEMMRKLFVLGVYRVEVEPLRINKRIVKLLRHYGFKQEGIKRSAFWMDGNDYDTVIMRMLKREWKQLGKEN